MLNSITDDARTWSRQLNMKKIRKGMNEIARSVSENALML